MEKSQLPMYYDNETHLLNFFVRYDHANPEIHGHDSTISPPTEDEDRNARISVATAQADIFALASQITQEPLIGSLRVGRGPLGF